MVADNPRPLHKRRRQEHGYGAYSGGRCKCPDICQPAAREYRRRQRAARLVYLTAHPDDPAHGNRASYECGCRCMACTDAKTGARANT